MCFCCFAYLQFLIFTFCFECRNFYRTVCLTKPDLSAILKAHCTALGLRAPKTLSDRLRTVVELSHQQIPRQKFHEVNLPAVLFAASLAAQKRRAKVKITIKS